MPLRQDLETFSSAVGRVNAPHLPQALAKRKVAGARYFMTPIKNSAGTANAPCQFFDNNHRCRRCARVASRRVASPIPHHSFGRFGMVYIVRNCNCERNRTKIPIAHFRGIRLNLPPIPRPYSSAGRWHWCTPALVRAGGAPPGPRYTSRTHKLCTAYWTKPIQ